MILDFFRYDFLLVIFIVKIPNKNYLDYALLMSPISCFLTSYGLKDLLACYHSWFMGNK